MAKETQQQSGGPGNWIGDAIKVVGGLLGRIGQRRRDARDRLPDWLSPADFNRNDKVVDYILIGGLVVIILIVAGLIKASGK